MRQPGQWGLHAEAGGGSRALVQGQVLGQSLGGLEAGGLDSHPVVVPASSPRSHSLPPSLLPFCFFPSSLPSFPDIYQGPSMHQERCQTLGRGSLFP